MSRGECAGYNVIQAQTMYTWLQKRASKKIEMYDELFRVDNVRAAYLTFIAVYEKQENIALNLMPFT